MLAAYVFHRLQTVLSVLLISMCHSFLFVSLPPLINRTLYIYITNYLFVCRKIMHVCWHLELSFCKCTSLGYVTGRWSPMCGAGSEQLTWICVHFAFICKVHIRAFYCKISCVLFVLLFVHRTSDVFLLWVLQESSAPHESVSRDGFTHRLYLTLSLCFDVFSCHILLLLFVLFHFSFINTRIHSHINIIYVTLLLSLLMQFHLPTIYDFILETFFLNSKPKCTIII